MAPSAAQVHDVLARHGRAVLARSSADVLHDLDPAQQAAGFRDRQVAQLANLAGVPLAAWGYSIEAPVTDTGVIAAARARYGTAVAIERVALSYRFSGVDAEPSVHELYWTFVRRSGRTVIAGDDDLATSGSMSWRGPWDFGPAAVARSGPVLVLGHPDAAAALPGIAATAAAAVPAVSAVVGSAWARAVAVFVPSSAGEFTDLTGGADSTDVAAVSVVDTSGGSRSARIVVRPDVLRTLSAVGLQITLRHELTHVATVATTTPITPRWLIEGLAEYVGNRGSGQPVAAAAADLGKQVRSGTLPSGLPKDADFGAQGRSLAVVYEQSWLACALLADRVGATGLADLYVAVGRTTAPDDTAFGLVLKARLGLSLDQFVAQWRAYLRARLG